jgi:hypothetical protein
VSTATEQLTISHSQYYLEGGYGERGEPPFAGGNGLIWVSDDRSAAVVMTGIEDGDLPVTVEILEAEPPQDLADWDEVVEVSLIFTGDTLALSTVPDVDSPTKLTLPATQEQTQSYRVRVHARGRDEGAEAGMVFADEGDVLVEDHRVSLWPAPPAPEARLKLTDEVGADIRARP